MNERSMRGYKNIIYYVHAFLDHVQRFNLRQNFTNIRLQCLGNSADRPTPKHNLFVCFDKGNERKEMNYD